MYQVTPLEHTYRTSNTAASLDTSSKIVKAVRGGAPGCTQGIDVIGGKGTFYADAITQAQAALIANGRPNVQKAIILLSDGDAAADATAQIATAKEANQCQHAIDAANAAKAATPSTWVYAIAYTASTSSSSSCGHNSPHISACSTLQKIAQIGTSDLSRFYLAQVPAPRRTRSPA